MGQRVFVKVVGFTDVERHALNTVFRLSEHSQVTYSPWDVEAPGAPRMLLVDGLCETAAAEAQAARKANLPFIWTGPRAPQGPWQCFTRPLVWTDVVMALDEYFLPSHELELDLDGDSIDTRPHVVSGPHGPACRAIIVANSPEDRLYLRAKLALALWTLADDAENLPRALELARSGTYELALIDLPAGTDPWDQLEDLRTLQPGLRGVVAIQAQPTPLDRVRARFRGLTLMRKPPHPGRLHALLGKLRFLPDRA